MNVTIEQAILDEPSYELRARSGGFREEWRPRVEQLCRGFGARPTGVHCPEAVFAQPLDKRQVLVVQAADLPSANEEPTERLAFRVLVIPREAYVVLMGDPFIVAERLPAPWNARGELPALTWPEELPPRRTVARIQQVLQRSDGPLLLGGVQALVDGSKLVFERPAPDPTLLRDLWELLPTRLRGELWPASFAFSGNLRFDAVVVPHAGRTEFADYLTAEQAENYPEGRYELNLQIAAEAGDQAELDALFARRTRAQTFRLGLFILVVVVAAAFVMRLFSPTPSQPRPNGNHKTTNEVRDGR